MTFRVIASPTLPVEGCRRVQWAARPYDRSPVERLAGPIAAGRLALWCVYQGALLCGFATLSRPHDGPALLRITIAPEHQRQGAGRMVLDVIVNAHGGPLKSFVAAHDEAARRFAEAAGFKVQRPDAMADRRQISLGLPPARRGTGDGEHSRASSLQSWGGSDDELQQVLAEAADALPEADDLRAASELDRLASWESLNRELSCLVIESQGSIAGLSLVEEDGPTQHVVVTYVRPRCRGQGLGRGMKAFSIARRAPERWLVTEVDGANTPIVHLNDSLGFVDITPLLCVRS